MGHRGLRAVGLLFPGDPSKVFFSDGQQALEHGFETVEVQGVGAVGLGVGRIVVHF